MPRHAPGRQRQVSVVVPRYSSFLVRFWRTESERRIEVEHIQSGGRLTVASLAGAIAWMSSLVSAPERTTDPAGPDALAVVDGAIADPGVVEKG